MLINTEYNRNKAVLEWHGDALFATLLGTLRYA